jgi:hypothetical protein
MAEEKAEPKAGRVDRYFDRFSSWLSERIAAFVAFLFLLFAAGAFYGTFIVSRFPEYGFYLLAAPIVLALIAYYNRTLATVLLAALVLIFLV